MGIPVNLKVPKTNGKLMWYMYTLLQKKRNFFEPIFSQ